VVEAKYDSMRGGWCFNKVVWPFGKRAWKNIRRGLGGFLDLSYMRWEMSLGSGFGMTCSVEI
jgi:hypothetical protein